jgi:hypothetical protein
MTALIVGDPDRAHELAAALGDAGLQEEVRAFDHAGEGAGEIGALARELVEIERALTEDPPTAVVLADAGDGALAATLVATKLLIPVAAAGLDSSPGANARVLAQLADGNLSADASEIAAWIEARPKLPRNSSEGHSCPERGM